jgi:hypothetical protein
LKGKTNKAVGKAKAAAGYQSGRGKTEAKGTAVKKKTS